MCAASLSTTFCLMEIDVDSLPYALRYRLLVSGITPRPIAFVSTISPQGQHNLAPYSFFAGVSSNPMTLLFCPANTEEGKEKDSLRNARPPAQGGSGCFVVNLATFAYRYPVSAASEALPHGESEFDLTGLHPAPALKVSAPRLLESPGGFECETLQILSLAEGQPAGGNIVIGRVVHAWFRDDLIDENYRIDPRALDTIGRMGGLSYCRTSAQFDMPRGRAALEASQKAENEGSEG